MYKKRLIATSLAAGMIVGLSGAWANNEGVTSVLLKGKVSGFSDQLPAGKWLTAEGGDATIQTPGALIRVQSGASVRLDEVTSTKSHLAARGGRIYVKVAEGSECLVAAGNKSVQSNMGEFLVDAKAEPRCYTLKGNLQVQGPTPSPTQSWKGVYRSLALDGPDVRKRNRNRRRFTQGEENRGKRIGEDLPPSHTPTATPTVAESPAFTPTPPQTPPPTPPPSNPPPTATAGGSSWPLIGGLLGAGGLAYFISTRTNGDTPQNIIRPFSP